MAYGARLESELGESPQGFKSPILRAKDHPRLSGVFLFRNSTRSTESEHLANRPISFRQLMPGRNRLQSVEIY